MPHFASRIALMFLPREFALADSSHTNMHSSDKRLLPIVIATIMGISVFSLPILLISHNALHLEQIKEVAILIDLALFAGSAFLLQKTSVMEMEYARARRAMQFVVKTRCEALPSRTVFAEEIYLFERTLDMALRRLHRKMKKGDKEAAQVFAQIPASADFCSLQQFLIREQKEMRERIHEDDYGEQYLQVTYQAALVSYLSDDAVLASEMVRQSLLLKPTSPACVLLLHAHILRDERSLHRASACYRKVLDLDVSQEDDLSKSIAFENLQILMPLLSRENPLRFQEGSCHLGQGSKPVIFNIEKSLHPKFLNQEDEDAIVLHKEV